MSVLIPLSSDLRFVSDTLDTLRFANMDQNPKGIRDILGNAIYRAEKLERALSCYKHPDGSPMWAPDGTLLDPAGNRSVFDDVDE